MGICSALREDGGTALQHLVRRALGILDDSAVGIRWTVDIILRMESKGASPHDGAGAFRSFLAQAQFVGIIDQGAFRGFAHGVVGGRSSSASLYKGHARQPGVSRRRPRCSTTVILFWVRVPVLSEQMTCVQPSVSTAVSLRMTALRLDILVTPMESTMVTTVASPSGMAATARLTATMKVSISGLAGDIGRRNKAHGKDDQRRCRSPAQLRILLSCPSLLCRGVWFVLGLGQRVSDLAHLRVHARARDDGASPAVDHGAAHIDHVLAVSQGHILARLRRSGRWTIL